ncbi:Lysine-specific demethylase JMJ21 [Linum perenne]
MENSQFPIPVFKDRRSDALGSLRVIPDEVIASILELLTPRDVANLACVSSVMYIFCNEEPLWMSLCLSKATGLMQYKGSWKKTTLHLENVADKVTSGRPLAFDGFSSLFLYRRLYRCNTTLNSFTFDGGNVERKKEISLEEFHNQYDGKKPVLLAGLADSWPARSSWTIDQLLMKYGDKAFRISQRSTRKLSMELKDYVAYVNCQHDEDPLYIFDDKFGESVPSLLKDYNVPHLFQEDYFDVLDREQRPPFRWLIIGPERSGASWHVDPALTSAWNTLLCGRKRWALYPPGRVPLGVTVHVNEDDGDVNIDTPSSLQWWLDFYPLLADEDKPIECTQLPGETIFVPSGWWHCVLNLETTIAVTQNFVNSKNFEFVCLDLTPGYHHKGVCRAGYLAIDEISLDYAKMSILGEKDDQSYPDLTRKEKRLKMQDGTEKPECEITTNGASRSHDLWRQDFSYDIEFLASLLDKERDHYNSPWSLGNCIGQREMRDWLYKLWINKPGARDLIWKGACLALNAEKWFHCLEAVCTFHNFPSPTTDERLPVGTGSNPVYLLPDCVVKIFVEDGLEASLYGLGTELQFYSLLHKVNSPLKRFVPEILASGIIYLENGTHKIEPWDGKGVPEIISRSNLISVVCEDDDFPFGVWSKNIHELSMANMPKNESMNPFGSTKIWPFIVTKRCKGKIFADLRDEISWEEALNLASFLGQQLRNLHLLPCPPINKVILPETDQKTEFALTNGQQVGDTDTSVNLDSPVEMEILIKTLYMKKKHVKTQLTTWGDPIPSSLVDQVDDYLPNDLSVLFPTHQDAIGQDEVCQPFSWIHADIMDDNIHMESSSASLNRDSEHSLPENSGSVNGCKAEGQRNFWSPGHIIDFSNLKTGDRILDIIPIYLDIFRGDSAFLKRLLDCYKLPLLVRKKSTSVQEKFGRLSYRAMCYCILHEENILGAIFGMWKELRAAKSWEEVELTVWGELNNYEAASN